MSFFDSSAFQMFSMGSTLLGGLLGAKGSYDSAKASKQAYAIQASIARQNAMIAGQQARIALANGQTAEGNVRLRTAQVFGAQRAAMAANGVDLGEGSPSDVLTTTAFMGERDALTVRDNAAQQAWGYRVQGVNASNNARLLDDAGDAVSPGMAAAGSLLATAGSVAGQWYGTEKKKGVAGTLLTTAGSVADPWYNLGKNQTTKLPWE